MFQECISHLQSDQCPWTLVQAPVQQVPLAAVAHYKEKATKNTQIINKYRN